MSRNCEHDRFPHSSSSQRLPMETLVESILQSMSNVKKPQQAFLKTLFAALTVFQGRAMFRNMSRYTDMSEKYFSRWYRRHFDFVGFMVLVLLQSLPKDSLKIAAIDASFIRGISGFIIAPVTKTWDPSCGGRCLL